MIAGLVRASLASLSRLVCLLSDAATRRLAALVAFLLFGVFRYRRRVIGENLKASFPELDAEAHERLARAVGVHLTLTLLEFLRMPRYAARGFDNVEIVGFENYERALAKGKGVLCLAGHLGSFELTAAAVGRALRPSKLWLVVKSFPPAVDHFVCDLRRGGGSDVIPAKGALRGVFAALRRRESVAFVLDQHAPGDSGVSTEFFGRPAQTLSALASVALRTGTPVIAATSHRRPDGTHLLEVHAEFPLEHRADRDETVRHMTQVYTRFLEQAIQSHPEQWFWSHRRWKSAPTPSPQ